MPLLSNDPSTSRTSASSASSARAPVDKRDWICPFCPLLCDDVVVESRDDGMLDAPDTECPRLSAGLAQYGAHDAKSEAFVDGQASAFDTALTHAATLLANARRPLFGGLATDVAGTRALYPLAAACGAMLDHLHGDALGAATLALQDRGAFFTTLSEIRSRADLLVFFGCEPSQRYPRFFTRILAGTEFERELIFVGSGVDPASAGFAQCRTGSLLPQADPFDVLAMWSAVAEGRTADALHRDGDTVAGQMAATLETLHARIAAARYTVLVYEPAALPGPHEALLIEALNRIVKTINRTTRAACLALGGDDGASTVNQALTWLSGMPLRTRVSKPTRLAGSAPLDHDPYRYRTHKLLAARETDALLWIASFAPQPWPAALDPGLALIVLGHPALADAARTRGANTVFVPVATPGIDSGGHLFRVDGTVVMRLVAARGEGLHETLQTVASIAARLTTLVNQQIAAVCAAQECP
ncbi:formylmethanofuran dehydrogenase, subunit B [Paraburkholderia fungorum]|uniref:Formylmethanofuran dehydrogenase, subunit B n=1 Tax=Paraburkholderia fungorum TaxID=134537 RepID=A0A1H1JCE3_9BURK|nr:formylmethanofuran dehydrogenase [Paraburkholderia fungorum]SDR47649.1 formylmethanofuran dehydrogenase, subunit B [Paraburkholderia fungorum]